VANATHIKPLVLSPFVDNNSMSPYDYYALGLPGSRDTRGVVRILTAEPMPAEVEQLLERRRLARADRHDELWDGVLHIASIPGSVGSTSVSLSTTTAALTAACFATAAQQSGTRPAALVLEIVSPGDDSWNKFGFFATHDVDEVLIVDPQKRSVDWFALRDGDYEPVEHSGLIDLGPPTSCSGSTGPRSTDSPGAFSCYPSVPVSGALVSRCTFAITARTVDADTSPRRRLRRSRLMARTW